MKKIMTALVALAALGSFASDVAEMAATELAAVVPGTIVRKSENGWLYSKNELEHLAKGQLAGGGAAQASVCKKAANADPVEALADFSAALKAEGIRLIVVPVPPKAAIQPWPGLAAGDAMTYLTVFYDELRGRGIEVLDLAPALLAGRDENVYCRTDAHWSPAGIRLAADAVAAAVGISGDGEYAVTPDAVEISGDLATSLDKTAPESEPVTLEKVSGKVFDDASPVLVIGDSHTLIFSTGGDMLAENAGFCEQLAARLKMPVERIGVKGSAATAVRVNLYRKAAKDPAWLKGKKVVVYCFSCREFTEAVSGWAKVPILKK